MNQSTQPSLPDQGKSALMAAEVSELAGIAAGAGKDDTLVLLCGRPQTWLDGIEEKQQEKLIVYPLGSEEEPAEGSRACWVSGPSGLAEALGNRLVYSPGGRVRIWSAPDAGACFAEEMEEARLVVGQAISRGRMDNLTRRRHLRTWCGHLAENTPRLAELPDVTHLAGVLAGAPAVVVGAGPSLDASLPQLARCQDKCLIIAAASALGPMSRAGVKPHLVVALEAIDESRQFDGELNGSCLLAAASTGHPNHFLKWPGPASYFHLTGFAQNLTGGGILPTGGHAGSAAFSLAFVFGCDPIMILGQDLAYSGGRMHAQDRPGGEDGGLDDTLEIEDIKGGLTRTSPAMLSYISWYQETAEYLKQKHPERLVVNCTGAGARVPGLPHVPLGWMLKDLAPLPDEVFDLAGMVQRLPKASPTVIAARLGRERATARAAGRALAETGFQAAIGSLAGDSMARAVLEAAAPAGDAQAAATELGELAGLLRRAEEKLYA